MVYDPITDSTRNRMTGWASIKEPIIVESRTMEINTVEDVSIMWIRYVTCSE